jgi:hypothetical protein
VGEGEGPLPWPLSRGSEGGPLDPSPERGDVWLFRGDLLVRLDAILSPRSCSAGAGELGWGVFGGPQSGKGPGMRACYFHSSSSTTRFVSADSVAARLTANVFTASL